MHALIEQHNLEQHRSRRPGPGLNLSALQQLDQALPIGGFAIKYVVEGLERYTVDGAVMPVRASHFLLANRCSRNHIVIDAPRPVKGLCIELTTELLDEVVQAREDPEAFSEKAGASFFSGPEFLESVHAAEHSVLGRMLQQIAADLFVDRGDLRYAGPDLYHALAEQVVQEHLAVLPRLRSLGAVRSGTRKDLYRRVERARAMLEADLQAPLSVPDMAREAAMSTYHFSRAFRQMAGQSPYQYRLRRRLEAARSALQKGLGSVQDVASEHGFADAASFSKAFRKHFGDAPSTVLFGSRSI